MDDILTEIKSLLTTALGSSYTYVYGEVKVPDDTLFPLIEIIPITTIFNRLGTGTLSDNEFEIKINYKNTLKKFIKGDTNVTTLAYLQDAVKVMEERDGTTGQPKAATILGTMLDNIRLTNNVDILQEFNIEYNINDFDGSWIAIASLTMTAKKKTPVN